MASSNHPVMLLYPDLSGVSRGRGIPADRLARHMQIGVGWVPADQAVTPLGPIADPNPWGSHGDLRLMPDPSTEVYLDLWDDAAPLHLLLCDAVETDGRPWDSCVRQVLKDGIAALGALGLRAQVSFEHEFSLTDPAMEGRPAPPGFSIESWRTAEPFGSQLLTALERAGVEPELVLPEYGASQFEAVVDPTDALAAADRAVVVREVTREVARRMGRRATFSPIVDPDGVGNGLHIHISLRDADGNPVMYDPDAEGNLSRTGGAFAAGIIDHVEALTALTAPSVISYARLTPHRWSAAYGVMGNRNREAALRIPPMIELGDSNPADSYRLEYRPADAAASPHLALGVLLQAGAMGIREGRQQPPLVNTDPSELSDHDHARLGVRRLPESLGAALEALAADRTVQSWLSDDLLACYRSMKQTEIELLADQSMQAACDRYRYVY